MWTIPLFATVGLVLVLLYRSLAGLRRNVAKAKSSGIHYRIVPILWLDPWWVILGPIFLRLGRWVQGGRRWWWLEHLSTMQSWTYKYATFEELGADMLMTVSPKANWLTIADADAIAQIMQRRNDFPKPIEYYQGVDVYGKNVVSTEGQHWRHHRRIVAPPFNEKNNRLVWDESVRQAQNMLRSWRNPLSNHHSQSITTLAQDTMRLSLYVISKAGFGRSIAWPGIDQQADPSAIPESAAEVATGHVLSYTDALGTLLRNLMLVIAIPRPILQYAPSKVFRGAYTAYREFGEYMKESYEQKRAEMKDRHTSNESNNSQHLDLITGLVHASAGENVENGGAADKKSPKQLLSREEIMGNAFVILLAGHETTANSIHFSLLLLAMHVDVQRKVQAELDSVFGDRPVTEWDYDKDLPYLANGLLGAVMAEQLRLIPAVKDLPRCTKTAQPLEIRGQRYIVPAGTYISICTPAAHRNPNFWPCATASKMRRSPYLLGNADNDLEEFKPERWLTSSQSGPTSPLSQTEIEESEHAASSSASTALYRPHRGAYLPFSEGYRSCLGRRFAQVEFFAVMAVILKTWSVELAVDEWASETELATMNSKEKRAVWQKARFAADDKLAHDMGGLITLQLKTGVSVPIRLVRRGEEQFDWKD